MRLNWIYPPCSNSSKRKPEMAQQSNGFMKVIDNILFPEVYNNEPTTKVNNVTTCCNVANMGKYQNTHAPGRETFPHFENCQQDPKKNNTQRFYALYSNPQFDDRKTGSSPPTTDNGWEIIDASDCKA